MLLILTNSQDATVDYFISVLKQSDVSFLRLDTDTLVSTTSVTYIPGQPTLCIYDQTYKHSDFQHVWYRRPDQLKSQLLSDLPEDKYSLDEWTEALEGFLAHIPRPKWMNHPSVNRLASHKLEQLTTAASIGFSIPDTIVTQDSKLLLEFFESHNRCVVVKPMSSGYIERPNGEDSLIYTNRIRNDDINDLTDLESCPTFFQEFIEKSSDVRITVVDQKNHAVEMIAKEVDGSQRCDIRRNNMSDVIYREILLPHSIERNVRHLMTHYGLRFAAIDMVVDENGGWHFLEVNPNGQWAWLDISAGTSIAASFVEAFSGNIATK